MNLVRKISGKGGIIDMVAIAITTGWGYLNQREPVTNEAFFMKTARSKNYQAPGMNARLCSSTAT
jgi:hypothetical protein